MWVLTAKIDAGHYSVDVFWNGPSVGDSFSNNNIVYERKKAKKWMTWKGADKVCDRINNSSIKIEYMGVEYYLEFKVEHEQ